MMRTTLGIAAVWASAALANPQGGTVTAGSATIAVDGKTLTVNQSTARAIINWQKFENTASETIRFVQPGNAAATLNRVVGIDPSFIGGQLTANGQVYLINPNGIVFAPTAQVNVGGLVASTLAITDQNFLTERDLFVQDPNAELSSVVNRGSIKAEQFGRVVLAGAVVDNSGTIEVKDGNVVLRAARFAALDTATSEEGSVQNRNVRVAEVGLTPLLEDVVNTESVATANRIQRLGDGTVYLRGAGGIVVNGGTIDVAGEFGGEVDVRADHTLGLGAGSHIKAAVPGDGGFVSLSANNRIKHSTVGTPGAEAVVDGALVSVRGFRAGIDPGAGGKIALRAFEVRVSGKSVGTPAGRLRVAGQTLHVEVSDAVSLFVDGDIEIDAVSSLFSSVDIEGTGSLFAGEGRMVFVGLDTSEGPNYINLLGQSVKLRVPGFIGTEDRALSVNLNPDTGPGFNEGAVILAVVNRLDAPLSPATPALDEAPPRARPRYTPPTDDVPAAPATPPLITVAPVAAIDAVVAAPVVPEAPASVGARDNVLLPALRVNSVKTGDAPAAGGTGDAITVQRGEPEEPEREKRADAR